MIDTSVKFREWATKYKYRLDSDEHGFYINTHTQSAWDAWRASEELWKILTNFGQSTQKK